MSQIADQIRVIDIDTHVVEPPDLWSSRMPSKWGDLIPHVRWDDDRKHDAWYIAGEYSMPAAAAAQSGWHEFAPDHPPRWENADPATYDPKKRLERMDQDGVFAQVLYANVALVNTKTITRVDNPEFRLDMIRAYNDFQTDFCRADPSRLVPITALPFWDLEATLTEIDRCDSMGHKGIAFSQDPTAFGAPQLTDCHWDPMWRAAEERQLSVNFHIASGDTSLSENNGHPDNGYHANYASMGVTWFVMNSKTIAQLICGGICHRHPDLKFVSVESGIGWMPFALEALDWQWKQCGVSQEHPEYELLPSEFFQRQIYASFWFEGASALAAIEQLGPDNILYESDYPHPTSMSIGPAEDAKRARDYIETIFADLPLETTRKILHDNAAKLYRLS